MRLRTLTMDDLPGLVALKSAANWNQTEEDLARVLRMEPEGCFGIEEDGVLAASASVVTYGDDLAWVGMVLTLPPFRGRGFARQLMERAVDYAGERPTRLDATDMGQPLYESLGFVVECAIERWRREAGPAGIQEPAVEPLRTDAALDRAVFGADRSALMQDFRRHQTASAGSGYAYARPGATAAYLGPCVASDPNDAEQLFHWFTARHAHEAAMIDLFPEHPHAPRIASSLGFAPFRHLKRMVRKPARPALPDPRIYAIAGFEWG